MSIDNLCLLNYVLKIYFTSYDFTVNKTPYCIEYCCTKHNIICYYGNKKHYNLNKLNKLIIFNSMI